MRYGLFGRSIGITRMALAAAVARMALAAAVAAPAA